MANSPSSKAFVLKLNLSSRGTMNLWWSFIFYLFVCFWPRHWRFTKSKCINENGCFIIKRIMKLVPRHVRLHSLAITLWTPTIYCVGLPHSALRDLTRISPSPDPKKHRRVFRIVWHWNVSNRSFGHCLLRTFWISSDWYLGFGIWVNTSDVLWCFLRHSYGCFTGPTVVLLGDGHYCIHICQTLATQPLISLYLCTSGRCHVVSKVRTALLVGSWALHCWLAHRLFAFFFSSSFACSEVHKWLINSDTPKTFSHSQWSCLSWLEGYKFTLLTLPATGHNVMTKIVCVFLINQLKQCGGQITWKASVSDILEYLSHHRGLMEGACCFITCWFITARNNAWQKSQKASLQSCFKLLLVIKNWR